MARRIEIELTSARPDGSWTWRAAGAREPRGVLDGGLLPREAKAGDVLRAEAEFEIEGITIVSVLAPKESSRPDPERIEILGSGRADGPGVTTQLVGRTDRRPGDRRRDRDDGRPRRDREGARPQDGRNTTRPRREGPPAEEERSGGGASRGAHPRRSDRAEGPDRPPRSDHRDRPERRERRDRPDRSDGPERRERSSGTREAAGAAGADRDIPSRRGERGPSKSSDRARSDERRARRLSPGRAHRQATMASLPPEQQPIAEQVLRGGIPAVRTALHLEREKAMAEGRPVPNTDQLIAMAESLLPRLKAAEWHDRAEAAAKDVDEISLRDLRSVVAGADVARDEETRALASQLREALDRRVEAMGSQWSNEIGKYLDENRVVRALRLAARPPEPATRLDAALDQRLTEAASQALAPDAPADRWLAVLDAVAASPVRRSVKPAGLPTDATPEVRRAAHQQSGRVPALAAMLGVSIPPPPVPAPSRRGGRRPPSPAPAGPPAKRKAARAEETPTPPVSADQAAQASDEALTPPAPAQQTAAGAAVDATSANPPDTPSPAPNPPALDATAAPAAGATPEPAADATPTPAPDPPAADATPTPAPDPPAADTAPTPAPIPPATTAASTPGAPPASQDTETAPAEASTDRGQDAVFVEELRQPIGEG